MLNTPEYIVTIYDLNNNPVLDISRFVTMTMKFTLNDVHTLEFEIDLVQFEKLADSINAEPRTLIYPQKTEVKVSRNGVLLFGGIISSADSELSEQTQIMQVRADSYIQYFATRYLSKTYTATDRSAIAWDAINTVQSVTNGSLGVTQGTLATIFNSDLTSDFQDVKTIIQRYTYAQPTTYDFEITPNKVFNTYTRLGSDKPEVELVYPQNITSIKVPRNADTLANKVIGLGSGIGQERLQTIQEDNVSQLNFRVKERKVTFNSVLQQQTLIDNTQGVLKQSTGVLVIPDVTVNGREFDISQNKVGDGINIRIDSSTYNNDVNGIKRISQMSVKVDENFSEEITLSFFNPNNGGEIANE